MVGASLDASQGDSSMTSYEERRRNREADLDAYIKAKRVVSLIIPVSLSVFEDTNNNPIYEKAFAVLRGLVAPTGRVTVIRSFLPSLIHDFKWYNFPDEERYDD